MADATVTGCPNGPFMVSGPVKLHDAESNEISVTLILFSYVCAGGHQRGLFAMEATATTTLGPS